MKIAIVALGSNLDDPVNQVLTAIEEIKSSKDITLISQSKLHITKPVGVIEQPDFINAVIKIKTSLLPIELLRFLQKIEHLHERIREVKWGPRTLDLDLIDYDNLILNTPELILPHPHAHERDFVQIPLNELN